MTRQWRARVRFDAHQAERAVSGGRLHSPTVHVSNWVVASAAVPAAVCPSASLRLDAKGTRRHVVTPPVLFVGIGCGTGCLARRCLFMSVGSCAHSLPGTRATACGLPRLYEPSG